jgi:pectin methylesterase-like acyl-CoA thioesterase
MRTTIRPAPLLALALLPFWLAAGTSGADAPTAPLALDLHGVFPAANATNVCPDTPLRLTFPAPPALGAAGTIRIVDAADNRVVETIDVSSPTATQAIGGLPDYKYHPVIIAGNVATIFPRNGELAYGHAYYVTVDTGVFKDGDTVYAGIAEPTEWRFTTKAAPPAAGTTKLTVAADGTGDFCTVQGALDFIPDGNTTPTTLLLRKGTYTEMVFFTNKHAITLMGEDRRQCVIAYATNERFNPAGGNPYAGSSDPGAAPHVGGHIYHRGVFLAHRVNDLTLANLTIRNTTPQGGSQAEAIILNGTPTARAILKDVDLYSYQDTLQINGQAYLTNCHLEGDVDFMWGTGPCFFENCTCRALRTGAYYTQIRNPATNHGYVYLHCTFDGPPGITGNYLSRIGTGRFPHSEVVLLDCTLGGAVAPVGWLLSGGREGNEHDPAQIHFWEFNSCDAAGQPVDVSLRMAGSRQLRQPEDAAVIADYRNPAFVLGQGWNPRAAPIFASPTEPPASR